MNRTTAGGVLAFVMVIGLLAAQAFAAGGSKPLTLTQAIAQTGLFSGLTEAERAALEGAAVLRHGEAGERIIEQGTSSDRMFVVLEGESEVRVQGELVATLPAQALVGEIEFLDGRPASADVTLLEASYVIELNHRKLERLMDQRPRMGYVLMSEIARIEARRLRAMDEK